MTDPAARDEWVQFVICHLLFFILKELKASSMIAIDKISKAYGDTPVIADLELSIEPQQVTVHGKEAVLVVDPARFDVVPKPPKEKTMAGFIERSKKYRGAPLKIHRNLGMTFRDKRGEIFPDETFEEDQER